MYTGIFTIKKVETKCIAKHLAENLHLATIVLQKIKRLSDSYTHIHVRPFGYQS